MALFARNEERGAAPGRVRWIGIHPGAANPEKCWPLDRFVTLGLAIVRGAAPGEERRLVVFDAPRERGRATAVHAGLLVGGVEAAFIQAGPLDDFIECAPSLDLLVCNDSGVMHIAAALGVPTVSFHALGRPTEWAPQQRGLDRVLRRPGDRVDPGRAGDRSGRARSRYQGVRPRSTIRRVICAPFALRRAKYTPADSLVPFQVSRWNPGSRSPAANRATQRPDTS